MTKQVCVGCGVEFVEGKGWAEEHDFRCANGRHGWLFTREEVDVAISGDAALRSLTLQKAAMDEAMNMRWQDKREQA